ncbi:MAG: hypothetical protein A2Z49_02935 [Chloroflexi bacterium RBG_19FT_COMBO_56_12]|nr:MAG: hypothetical protein A2Z49_02935 [Chloroflexi bacterium RBG_19FT_COMBO_56_12]
MLANRKALKSIFVRISLIGLLSVLAFLFSACQPEVLPPQLVSDTPTASPARPTQTLTPSQTPTTTSTITPSVTPTASNTPTATVTDTPITLAQFSSPGLRAGIQPETYLAGTCEYLRLRWGKSKAEPGTVVVPVMFHSIVQPPSKVTDPKDITVEEFQSFVYYANSLGFETITTQELLNFLLYNDPIPPRSMILIVDDRRPGLIYEHFMPVLDWTVTAAYIADPNNLNWAWDWMERIYESGRLDVQSHGYTGQLYILSDTPLEKIQQEIWDSTAVLEEHFGTRPIAFIWPGGNFTPLSAQVAREGGYQLGFTAYSRGPLLFNWIPLGEEEQLVNDPLMVLPRAWSNSVNYNLDEAIRVSEQAVAFAEANAEAEKAWLHKYCSEN